MDTTLIHEICTLLDIKEKKALVVKLQRYEEGALLRDVERQIMSNISKIMVSSGIITDEEVSNDRIEDILDKYLFNNYGFRFYGDETSTELKRELKLQEILRKD